MTSGVRGGGVGSTGEGCSYVAILQSPQNYSPTSQLLLGGQSRMTQRNTRSPLAFMFASATLIIRRCRHCSSRLMRLVQPPLPPPSSGRLPWCVFTRNRLLQRLLQMTHRATMSAVRLHPPIHFFFSHPSPCFLRLKVLQEV